MPAAAWLAAIFLQQLLDLLRLESLLLQRLFQLLLVHLGQLLVQPELLQLLFQVAFLFGQLLQFLRQLLQLLGHVLPLLVGQLAAGQVLLQLAEQVGGLGEIPLGQGHANLLRERIGRAAQPLEHLLHHVGGVDLGIALHLLELVREIAQGLDGLAFDLLGLTGLRQPFQLLQFLLQRRIVQLLHDRLDRVRRLLDLGLGLLDLLGLLLLLLFLLQKAQQVLLGHEKDQRDHDEPRPRAIVPASG